MSHHHDGLTHLVHGVANEAQDLRARVEIDIAGGLVGEDHLRLAGQRPCHRHALLLATRQLAGPVLEAVGQAGGADHLVDPVGVARAAGEVHRQHDVLDGGQRGDQVERLEHEPHVVAAQQREIAFGQGGQVDLADEHLPLGDPVQSRHAVHEGGLARARRPHDGGELSLLERHVDGVECAHRSVARAVDLGGGDGSRRCMRGWSRDRHEASLRGHRPRGCRPACNSTHADLPPTFRFFSGSQGGTPVAGGERSEDVTP